jgi:uncharacterized membrane protein YhhN
MRKPLLYAYWATTIVQLFALLAHNTTLIFISKPLLMIILVLYYAKSITGPTTKFHKLMIAAFIFSWVGDVALMFVHVNENFFLLGLVGFLITHLLYAYAFTLVTHTNHPAILPKKAWVVMPLFIYMVALLSMLVPAIYGNPATKPFLAPVLVYTTAISVMVILAINRYKRVNDISFALVFAGALLFMFSDSLIAINKFLNPLPMVDFFIMLLYITGQYLIADGCLKQEEKQLAG